MPDCPVHPPLLAWYASHARDLPWRRRDASAWHVLVSEMMLQQTPVARVLPVYDAWVARWPTPGALAGDRPGEAVRRWGRLGYPRRALRLHEAAKVIDTLHGGEVPRDPFALRSLPGVGDYTAAAVLAFAYRRRVAVLDTNVRRVLGRVQRGVALPPPTVTTMERSFAEESLPDDPEAAAVWSVAVMELGALVCTARAPACPRCPVASSCAWRAAGRPRPLDPRTKAQAYAGSDRQCRGRILQAVRDADAPLTEPTLAVTWEDTAQRHRALASLLADGLVVQVGDGLFDLP